jgi:hypothetical protein
VPILKQRRMPVKIRGDDPIVLDGKLIIQSLGQLKEAHGRYEAFTCSKKLRAKPRNDDEWRKGKLRDP